VTQRITLTISDDLAERLTWLADHYDCDVIELTHELLIDSIHFCQATIEAEACEQIRLLMEAPAIGRA